MRTVRIVTSFIRSGGRFLILKRSSKVRSMQGLWSGVSGTIEGDEDPLVRAEIEIFEEVGIRHDAITLVNAAAEMTVRSPLHGGEWRIHPFLFGAENPAVRLNWENSDFRWIRIGDLKRYRTVPELGSVLLGLL